MIKKFTFALMSALLCGTTAFAATKVATFKFDQNYWNIPSQDGKILLTDNTSIVQDGVTMKFYNIAGANKWCVLEPPTFNCPKDAKFSFEVGNGGQITKIIFTTTPNSDFEEDGHYTGIKWLGQDTYNWIGSKAMVKIKCFDDSGFKKIEVTYEAQEVTGVETIESNNEPAAVYNMQGVKLGTSNMLNNLPAGIYIVGGKKVVK